MQGRGSWMASCVCVCEHEYVFVGLCDFMQQYVCLRLGPRLLPEVEFHSLLFHYSYKATARLHRVQSCKNFFFPVPRCLRPPLLLLFFFSLFHGYSWNGNKHLWKCISLHFGILGRSWAGLIQFQTTLNMNQCFSNLKQLQNGSSEIPAVFSGSNNLTATIFSSSSNMFSFSGVSQLCTFSYISLQLAWAYELLFWSLQEYLTLWCNNYWRSGCEIVWWFLTCFAKSISHFSVNNVKALTYLHTVYLNVHKKLTKTWKELDWIGNKSYLIGSCCHC